MADDAQNLFGDDEEELSGKKPDNEIDHVRAVSHEGESADELARREDSVGQESETQPDGQTASLGAIKASEEGAPTEASLYNSGGDKPGKKGDGRLKGLLKHKWLVGGAAFGSGGFIIIILLLFFFLGSMKLPDIAEHITAYQFARVSRTYAEHASAITAEDTSISTASDSTISKLASQFKNVKDKTWGSMWDKINNYRPDKIVENLQESGRLDFKYERGGISSLWKKKLTAIVVDGKEIPVNDPSLWNKYVHPLQTRSDYLQFSSDMNQALADAMQGRSVIIRGAVAKSIRDQLGIKLRWWDQTKYSGKSDEEAAALEEEDSFKQITQGEQPVGATSENIDNATADAEAEIERCLADTTCAEGVVKAEGDVASADAVISKDISGGFLDKVSGVLGAFSAAVPACLIYDGSMGSNGQQQIDQTSTADQRAYYAITTSADQQKYGDTVGEAAGAMNTKTGDISSSIPEERSGGSVVDTTSIDRPQASALGNYTIANAVLPGPLAGFINDIAGPVCPTITNPYVNIGAGLVSLLGGGISKVLERGADTAVSDAISQYIKQLVKEFELKKELTSLGKVTAGVTGATLLAQMVVNSKMSAANIALSMGPPFVDHADAGGNLNAQEVARRFYGRPLFNAEVAASTPKDQAFQANQLAQESAFQRYFATSNPDSLVTHLGSALQTHMSVSWATSLLESVSKILNPLASLVRGMGSLSHSVASAASATSADTQNYGVVQWGWSNDEENLIKTDASYRPIENQAVIEDPSKTYCQAYDTKHNVCVDREQITQLISETWSKCWGYNTAGAPDPSATMGYLLNNQAIERTADGDIQNDGMSINTSTSGDIVYINTAPSGAYCSPSYLGTDNEVGIPLNAGLELGDLVFRYRLEHSNELTVDQQENVQEIPNSTPSPTPQVATSETAITQQVTQ